MQFLANRIRTASQLMFTCTYIMLLKWKLLSFVGYNGIYIIIITFKNPLFPSPPSPPPPLPSPPFSPPFLSFPPATEKIMPQLCLLVVRAVLGRNETFETSRAIWNIARDIWNIAREKWNKWNSWPARTYAYNTYRDRFLNARCEIETWQIRRCAMETWRNT